MEFPMAQTVTVFIDEFSVDLYYLLLHCRTPSPCNEEISTPIKKSTMSSFDMETA